MHLYLSTPRSQIARPFSKQKGQVYLKFVIGPGGVLPYIGYIGMCGAKGYGFFSRFGRPRKFEDTPTIDKVFEQN